MKIAMMGAWNTDSGASIHAEMVGRAWVEKGIDLKVYTFLRDSFHGTAITKEPDEEESYVSRCFPVYPHEGIKKCDLSALLETDYDVFITEDLGMLPMKHLLEIFPKIKKKAKTVTVIHDNKLSDKPEFFKFDWDRVVCFDDRYYDFLKDAYPKDKIKHIPFPALPLKKYDMSLARKELGLPLDKKIVFVFGHAAEYTINTSMVLDRFAEKEGVMMVVASKGKRVLDAFARIEGKTKFELKIIKEFLDEDMLFKYLQATDCLLYNKPAIESAVVASTVFQCLGGGRPIVSRESSFVYSFNEEVLKYRNYYELEEALQDVFEEGPGYKAWDKAIVEYLSENSDTGVADKFLKLFDEIN